MADDLSAPLGLASGKQPWWRRLPFGVVGGGLLGLTGVMLGVWLAFVRDPNGTFVLTLPVASQLVMQCTSSKTTRVDSAILATPMVATISRFTSGRPRNR